MARVKPALAKSKEYQDRYHAKNPGLKAKWNREWNINNRDRLNASKYKYRDKVKELVIGHYSKGSMSCNYCGFSNMDALCIDHINDDGAEWRKNNKSSGRGITGMQSIQVIKKLGYPEGLQVLCANCNLIKEIQKKNINRNKNKWYARNNNSSQLFA